MNPASPNPSYSAPPAAATGGTNPLAIGALVVGILALLSLCGIVFGPVSLILGIIAAVLGYVARNQIRQRGQGGSGLAMAGLVLGILAALLGLLELAGLGAMLGLGGSVVNQALTSIPLTLTAGATPAP